MMLRFVLVWMDGILGERNWIGLMIRNKLIFDV